MSPILKVNFGIGKILFGRFETYFNTRKGVAIGQTHSKANQKPLIYCSYRCRKSHYFTTFGAPPSEVEQLVHAIILYVVL
jgi:hypothetical protein